MFVSSWHQPADCRWTHHISTTCGWWCNLLALLLPIMIHKQKQYWDRLPPWTRCAKEFDQPDILSNVEMFSSQWWVIIYIYDIFRVCSSSHIPCFVCKLNRRFFYCFLTCAAYWLYNFLCVRIFKFIDPIFLAKHCFWHFPIQYR